VTAASPIRLVLAGSNAIVLACLERLFALEENFAVVARCGKGEDVLDAVKILRPDVLLLDVTMSAIEIVTLLRDLKRFGLAMHVVLLTESLPDAELATAVRLGARGILPKEVTPSELAQCIRRVHGGGSWLRVGPSAGRKRRPDDEDESLLTPRELEIVGLIAEGLVNKEIAHRLAIGEATVRTHLHRIYEKLRLRDRLQLTLYTQKKRPT